MCLVFHSLRSIAFAAQRCFPEVLPEERPEVLPEGLPVGAAGWLKKHVKNVSSGRCC